MTVQMCRDSAGGGRKQINYIFGARVEELEKIMKDYDPRKLIVEPKNQAGYLIRLLTAR